MSGLKRALGLPGLSFFGIGMILGAGIYSVIGSAAKEAGPGLWLSFLIASIVALLTGLSYAELATMYPKAGAEYVYLTAAAPRRKWLASIVALLVACSGIATCATVALAFAGYLGDLIGLEGWKIEHSIAFALLIFCAAITVIGILQSSWVNIVFTLIEVSGLILVIAIAAASPELGDRHFTPRGLSVLPAAALVFFSFLGFENIVNLAEEAKEPEKKIPRAILISVAVTTIIYLLVALAALVLLSPEELGASSSPLADAVASRSRGAALALAFIALFATANTALVSMIVSSRLLFGTAEQGGAPKSLARVLPRRKTPVLAIAVVFVAASGLTLAGDVATVAKISSFASLIAFFGVNVALIALRIREPAKKRPFRVPLSVGRVPVLPLIGAASNVLLAITIIT